MKSPIRTTLGVRFVTTARQRALRECLIAILSTLPQSLRDALGGGQ
jgi:hypothetical protein